MSIAEILAACVMSVLCFKMSPAQNVWDGKTIEVRGINTSTNDEAIEMFFESKRRSGGDTVEKIQRYADSHITYVTMENADG